MKETTVYSTAAAATATNYVLPTCTTHASCQRLRPASAMKVFGCWSTGLDHLPPEIRQPNTEMGEFRPLLRTHLFRDNGESGAVVTLLQCAKQCHVQSLPLADYCYCYCYYYYYCYY